MRYFLELRYNGAAYCGWQRQPDQPSVQQTLERALATLLREPVALTGAGRTDTGVNAAYYVAHFDCERPVADPAPHVDALRVRAAVHPDQRVSERPASCVHRQHGRCL